MKGGLGNLMKQAQKMQEEMQKAQAEIANIEVQGQSGGGLVVVQMNAQHELKKVTIDPTLFEEDKDMLEDLIAAAVNDASHKLDSQTKDKMSSVTAGMPLPPGFKMPF